jgi:rubrerythrin
MSEENEEYGVKKIKVNIDRSPEVEAIRQEKEAVEAELEEKKSILEANALEEFEEHKRKLAEQFNDENIKDFGSPKELYEYIASLTSDKPPQKPVPHGKAPMFSAETGAGSSTELLDDLYDKAYVNSSKYDKETVEDAKQKINTLWESLLSSRSWSQLREGGTHKIEQHKLSSCPQCGFTLVDRSDCPNCGYDPTQRTRVVKTRVFKSPDNKNPL